MDQAQPRLPPRRPPHLSPILSNPQDGGNVNAALFGLEEFGHMSEAQDIRLSLLNSPHPDVVRTALLGFRDSQYASMLIDQYASMLIDLLSKHSHPDVQISLVRTLCKMPSASKLSLPVILPLLANPTLRPHIADALGDLADPTAIPHLEKLLDDSTEAWEIDNHGPMLRVRDLAAESIRKIQSGRTHRPT